jgi:outer membrane protein assembly factor BamE
MRLAAILCVLALGGCVYRIDVQQGNYVTQDIAAKVKQGMTKAEVRQALGTPLLVDIFHANRWDYYFSNVKGGRAEDRTRLSIFFENDKVVAITGEARPQGSSPTLSTPLGTPPPPRPGSQPGK